MTREAKGRPKLLIWLIAGLVILFIVMCSGLEWILQLPFYLVVGWIFYLNRTVPEITWNWEAIASGGTYLVLSVAGFHLVARSIAKSRGAAWPWKRSVCLSMLVLLVFGVSLAIGGIMHEAAWLARADRWIGGRFIGRSAVSRQISNARQLILFVRLYAADEGGRYPGTLEQLVSAGSMEELHTFEKLSAFSGDTKEPSAPWIYVRGLSDSAPGELPVIIAPFPYKSGRRIIGTNDTSVELMKRSDIQKLVPKWKAGYAALGVPLPEVLQEYDVPPQ